MNTALNYEMSDPAPRHQGRDFSSPYSRNGTALRTRKLILFAHAETDNRTARPAIGTTPPLAAGPTRELYLALIERGISRFALFGRASARRHRRTRIPPRRHKAIPRAAQLSVVPT